MHESDEFLLAELEGSATTLIEALARPETLGDDVARGGWCCRFYSRLSPADIHYLETTIDLAIGQDFAKRQPVEFVGREPARPLPLAQCFVSSTNTPGDVGGLTPCNSSTEPSCRST